MRLPVLLSIVAILIACGSRDTGSLPTPISTSTTSIEATAGVTLTSQATSTAVPRETVQPTRTPTQRPVAATPTPPALGTGISGVALVGPSCPVAREDDPCPDKPWPGVVVARTLSGTEVGRAATDNEGRFSIQLPPGNYRVVTLTTGIFPAPASVEVIVIAGQMTPVELLLDSGIR